MSTTPQPPVAPERVVARLRPHARAMFWPSLLLIADAGAYGYFAHWFEGRVPDSVVLLAAVIVALLVFGLPLAFWLANRVVVTTRRIVVRGGSVVRSRVELLHSRGYDVELRQGPLQWMFRSGTLRIAVGGETALTLRDVPKARVVQGALHDLMENAATLQSNQRRLFDTPAITRSTTAWTGR